MTDCSRRGFLGTVLGGVVVWFGGTFNSDVGRELVWTTNDGRQVKIKDMTDEHLRNCIYWMTRNDKRQQFTIRLGTQAGRVGMLGEQPFEPYYSAMRREATRRNLRWI